LIWLLSSAGHRVMLNEEVNPCGTDMLSAFRPDQHATELARVATARRNGRRWSTRKHARARVPAVPSNHVIPRRWMIATSERLHPSYRFWIPRMPNCPTSRRRSIHQIEYVS